VSQTRGVKGAQRFQPTQIAPQPIMASPRGDLNHGRGLLSLHDRSVYSGKGHLLRAKWITCIQAGFLLLMYMLKWCSSSFLCWICKAAVHRHLNILLYTDCYKRHIMVYGPVLCVFRPLEAFQQHHHSPIHTLQGKRGVKCFAQGHVNMD